jgi:two-component system C4-dicarboxylate transport sensor histidine kinase DctB
MVELSHAHARFAKATFGIYLGVAALAMGLLVMTLASDLRYDEHQLQERLLLETDVRAHAFAQHLELLAKELKRLGLRAEIDPLDENIAPERRLLELSHKKSTFFNVGVAVIGPRGDLLWGEPAGFLPPLARFAEEPWFAQMRESGLLGIFPVAPDRADSLFYVVSPILRGGNFAGALLGAVDLARSDAMRLDGGARTPAALALAMPDGTVIYPATPPPYAAEPAWQAVRGQFGSDPTTSRSKLEGERVVLATAPVAGSELHFVSFVPERILFADVRKRMRTRVVFGSVIALAPLGVLISLLSRSLRVFRRSEERAVRDEHLRLLGEASNLIAHEVKNALNGLSMGIDLVSRDAPTRPGARERITQELRHKIAQLSDFTTALMTFSKGIKPRPVVMDLGELAAEVTALASEASEELNTVVEIDRPSEPILILADPTLIHVVVSNLLENAIDAVNINQSLDVGRIFISIRMHQDRVELRVTDSGAGVDPSMTGRLFEPFQTGKPSGVGIGLALAKKIALAHGGDLRLDGSDPSARLPLSGATFLLVLPVLPIQVNS